MSTLRTSPAARNDAADFAEAKSETKTAKKNKKKDPGGAKKRALTFYFLSSFLIFFSLLFFFSLFSLFFPVLKVIIITITLILFSIFLKIINYESLSTNNYFYLFSRFLIPCARGGVLLHNTYRKTHNLTDRTEPAYRESH